MTRFFAFCAVLACAPLVWAGEPASPSPLPRALPESDVIADPLLKTGTFANGVRWAWMRHDQPADKVSLRLHVIAGSLDEEEDERGLAHFLEHMAFNGTTSFPPGAMVPLLQAQGIAFGAHSNAHTSFDETVYKLELPNHSAAMVDLGLRVMADSAAGMLIDPAEVLRERGVILAEMRDRDSPGLRAFRAIYAASHEGMMISRRFPIGVKETVGAATAGIVRQFYQRMYRPERFVVSVVGAVDASIEAQIAKHFAVIPPSTAAQPRAAVLSQGRLLPGATVAIHRDGEANGCDLHLTRTRQIPQPADTLAQRRESLLQQIAMRVLSRRYAQQIENAPSGPLVSAQPRSQYGLGCQTIWLSATIRPGQESAAVAALEHPLRSLREFGPTAGELALECTAIRSELDKAVAQAASRNARDLAEMIVGFIADGFIPQSPQQERELELPWLAAATPAAVRDALRRAWGEDAVSRSACVLSGRVGAITLDELRAAWTAASTAVLTPPAEQAAITWAYPSSNTPPVVLQPIAGGVWTARVSDGCAVLVRPATAQPGQVLIEARLHHGLDQRPIGAGELMSRTFINAGLGRHAISELRQVLAGTSIQNLRAFADEDGTVLAADCVPGDLAMALRILAAYLADPGWRSESEGPARTAWLNALNAEAGNLPATFNRRFVELVAAGEIQRQRRSATIADVTALTWAQTQAWYTPRLRSAPLSVTIVGDVDPRAIAPALAELSSVSQRDPLPLRARGDASWMQPTPPWRAGAERFSITAAKPHAIVRVAWPTADATDISAQRRALMVAGCLREHLRERVRQQLGIAYSPVAARVSSEAWAGSGWLYAEVQCAPDKAEVALNEIRALAATMRSDGISEALLNQVKTPMMMEIAATTTRNAFWQNVLTRAAVQPFRIDAALNLGQELSAISATVATATARSVLAPERELSLIGTALPATSP